jgi:hypothetical protein
MAYDSVGSLDNMNDRAQCQSESLLTIREQLPSGHLLDPRLDSEGGSGVRGGCNIGSW